MLTLVTFGLECCIDSEKFQTLFDLVLNYFCLPVVGAIGIRYDGDILRIVRHQNLWLFTISGCQMVPDIIWLPTDVMRTKQTNKLITLHLLGISDLVVTFKEGFRQLRIKSCIA